MSEVISRCKCGASYTREQWDALRLVGHQAVPATATEQEECLELRNCMACDSTIAIEMLAPGPVDEGSSP